MCFEHRWWYRTTAFPAPRSTPPYSTATTPTSFWPTMELWESMGVRSSSDANWKSLLLSRKSASVSDILLCFVPCGSGISGGGGIIFCVHGMWGWGGGEVNLCLWYPVLKKGRTVWEQMALNSKLKSYFFCAFA